MKKFLLLLSVLFSVFTSNGQIIWQEDFESYANHTGLGNNEINSGDYPLSSNKWIIDAASCTLDNNDYFYTDYGWMHTKDTDGDAYWYSESIDISGSTTVSMSVDFKESGMSWLSFSYYQCSYELNNSGTWTDFDTNGAVMGSFDKLTASQSGISGTSLKLRVLFNNSSSEHYYFDNVRVYTSTYNGSFETGVEGWTFYDGGGTSDWQRTNNGGSRSPGDLGHDGTWYMWFDGRNKDADDWLISPSYDFSNKEDCEMYFWSWRRYNGSNIQMKVSSNYSGAGDPQASGVTWTNVYPTLPSYNKEWTFSNFVSLGAFDGESNVHIAFYYSGTDVDRNWAIDDYGILVKPVNYSPCSRENKQLAMQDFDATNTLPYVINIGSFSSASGNSGTGDSPSSSPMYTSTSTSWKVSNEKVDADFGPIDISDIKNVKITFNIAAFSLGASSNGVDSGDYLAAFISDDNGATWSNEVQIVGRTNSRYAFGTYDTDPTVVYDGDNSPVYIQLSSNTKAKGKVGKITLIIPNNANIDNLLLGFLIETDDSREAWLIDDIRISGMVKSETIWETNAGVLQWSDGVPSSHKVAVFDNNYVTATDGNINACEIKIHSGNSLTISDNTAVLIESDITNNGSLLVNNEGSLVQHDDDADLTGTGVYQLNKTSLGLDHYYDYVYWSSPINSTTLNFGDILANAWRYYKFDPNEANNGHAYPGWVQLASTDIPDKGIGYAISAPTSHSSGSTLTANFVKNNDPFNNGNISVTVLKKGGPDNIGDTNIIGNPYPSAIDFNLFAADADNTNIEASYSLWTNCAGLSGNAHQSSGFTTYSVSGTNTAACSGTGGTAQANRYIATGQGFVVVATTDNSTVTFKNDFRVTDHNDNFLNRSPQQNIVWLDMTDDQGQYNQIAIGFYPNATEDFDRDFDASSMNTGSGFALYSTVDAKKLAIQGLPELNDTDKIIPLGVESDVARTITIHINRTEGLTNEPIYIKDLYLNTIHNLKTSDYTTTVTAGDFTDRFELIFTQRTMNTDAIMVNPNAVLIAQQSGIFTLTSNNKMNITGITVYDISGKIIYNIQEIDNTSHQVNLQNIATGNMLIFRIQINNEKIIVKKTIKE